MTAADFVRAALAYHFVMVAAFYVSAVMADVARRGTSPVSHSDGDIRQTISHVAFRFFRGLILTVCVARAVDPRLDGWLGVFPGWMTAPSMLLGLFLIVVSFFWTVYVHRYMSTDWRSGVPRQGEPLPPLLTEGPFARLRHPMFTGVALGQIGLVLAFPSWFSLVCLAVGSTMLVLQARREDDALAERHGPAWHRYAATTPAWPFGAAR